MSTLARERERIANRERMARKRSDLGYRAQVNNRRRVQEAERKAVDPALRSQRRANRKRYYEKRKSDAAFKRRRAEYLKAWLAERRLTEEFEAFVTRMENEGKEW